MHRWLKLKPNRDELLNGPVLEVCIKCGLKRQRYSFPFCLKSGALYTDVRGKQKRTQRIPIHCH
jgi:hypothetical protein